MNQTHVLGLDLATVSGLAIFDISTLEVAAYEVTGNPFEQFKLMAENIENLTISCVGIEMVMSFNNAKTTRSLLERYGYFKWTLKSLEIPIHEIHPKSARKQFGATTKLNALLLVNKRLKTARCATSYNHSDAVLVALAAARKHGLSFDNDSILVHIKETLR